GVASDPGMGAAERKLRVAIVIEADRGPLVRVVARFAFGAIASGMDVLNAVAIDAGNADAFVAFADVTGCAGDIAVGVAQRKLRLVMVVGLHAPPIRFSVTAIARFAEPPLVGILRLVTVKAPPRRVTKLDILGVAAGAWHVPVRVAQL